MESKFVATLSDGSVAFEDHGQWKVEPGQRKPWVRLTEFAADKGLHLTDLQLKVGDRLIHLPSERFDRFGLSGISPQYYSLSYHLEVDYQMGGSASEKHFVDLAAHFDDFAIHYIQDSSVEADSWIVVTRGDTPLAASPTNNK